MESVFNKVYCLRSEIEFQHLKPLKDLLVLKLLNDFADTLQKVDHMQSYLWVTEDIEELNYEY